MITISMPEEEYRTNLANARESGRHDGMRNTQFEMAGVVMALLRDDNTHIIVPREAHERVSEMIDAIRAYKKEKARSTGE